MNKRLIHRSCTSLLALTLLAGCAQSPTEVYVNMTTAAQMGDKDGFLQGFTMKSRALVDSLISLSEAYGMNQSNPYTLLIFDEIESETIEGDQAVLRVRHREEAHLSLREVSNQPRELLKHASAPWVVRRLQVLRS